MKKSFLLVTVLISLLLSSCNGCSDKKSNKRSVQDVIETYTPAPKMNTSGADTAEVMNQVQTFIGRLKSKDIEGAMDMLYYLNKDSIKHLPPELARRGRTLLNVVQGASRYDVENLTFHKEKDNKVRIVVTLFEKDDNDPAPNTMGMILKPVRRDGRWYLTLADTESDSNHGTEIKN